MKRDTLRTIDDKSGRPRDVERRQSEPMIDAVTLDHRAIGIDEDREGQNHERGSMRPPLRRAGRQ